MNIYKFQITIIRDSRSNERYTEDKSTDDRQGVMEIIFECEGQLK